VTIATNMAGRGTDIKLGEGVRETGGLFIMGTERHKRGGSTISCADVPDAKATRECLNSMFPWKMN